MLNKFGSQTSTSPNDAHAANHDEPVIDLAEAFRGLRRHKALIAGVLGLAILGAVVYIATTPPRFTATSLMLFDARKIEPFQQQWTSNVTADSAFVDSQVEILKAENIARAVVKQLDLQSDAEFAPQGGRSLRRISEAALGLSESAGQSDQLGRIVRSFRKNLTINRIGLTYVVRIEFRSLDPNKAARISNAVAEAYIAGELDSKSQAARRANVWLQDRMSELRKLAESTERTALEYKARNSAVATPASPLTDQQLTELASQRRVVLQDLESSVQTYRALHEQLLQRIAEFTQQQSFPATEARVVSPASAPLEKSEPKTLPILAVASLLGLVGGLGAAFAREYFDGSLRSSRQVQKEIGIDCLGLLPTIVLRRRQLRSKSRQHAASGERVMSPPVGTHRFVVGDPLSRFAETIRSLQVVADSADCHRPNTVIGVTSVRSGEGKSLVAANLSEMIAISGRRVLLIDCELRNGGLTGQFAPQAKAGLLEVIAGGALAKELTWRDPDTGLDFLPAVKTPVRHDSLSPAGLLQRTQLTRAGLRTLLQSVNGGYDYVILDLPPMTPVPDVKAMSEQVDAFILVIESGRTSRQAVIDALSAAPPVFEKLLGVVLNKADRTN